MRMNVWEKLIKGDLERKSRFHDLGGEVVDSRELMRLPIALWYWVRSRLRMYPVVPWIPVAARRRFEELAECNWHVVECGAGMSTIWWAKRVARVSSFESNAAWAQAVTKRLADSGIGTATIYEFDELEARFRSVCDGANMIVIDSIKRGRCAELAMTYAASGTWIYLDNSDRRSQQPDIAKAVEIIRRGARKTSIQHFRGYAPGQLAPTEGMMAQIA